VGLGAGHLLPVQEQYGLVAGVLDLKLRYRPALADLGDQESPAL